MKKVWSFLVGLQIIVPVFAQNQEVLAGGVQDAQEVLAQIEESQEAVPAKESLVQQVKKFQFLADWLHRSRDCLSGIGCSKKKSYLANYALGVAIGFGQGVLLTTYPHIVQKTGLLVLIARELGYRYTVREPVHLFRCLTFRGCSDQTKRYAFFNLGLIGGIFTGSVSAIVTLRLKVGYGEYARQRWVRITDSSIKSELGLSPTLTFYEWYKILGLDRAPSKREANKKYRKLALKYHPDKNPPGDQLAEGVMRVLSDANDKMKKFYSEIPEEQSGWQYEDPLMIGK